MSDQIGKMSNQRGDLKGQCPVMEEKSFPAPQQLRIYMYFKAISSTWDTIH